MAAHTEAGSPGRRARGERAANGGWTRVDRELERQRARIMDRPRVVLANIGLCLAGGLEPEHACRVTCEICTSQIPSRQRSATPGGPKYRDDDI